MLKKLSHGRNWNFPRGGTENHPSQTQCERSFLEANELAFMHKSEADKAVPQKILEMFDFIDDLIGSDRWATKLKKEAKLLDEVFVKSKRDSLTS